MSKSCMPRLEGANAASSYAARRSSDAVTSFYLLCVTTSVARGRLPSSSSTWPPDPWAEIPATNSRAETQAYDTRLPRHLLSSSALEGGGHEKHNSAPPRNGKEERREEGGTMKASGGWDGFTCAAGEDGVLALLIPCFFALATCCLFLVPFFSLLASPARFSATPCMTKTPVSLIDMTRIWQMEFDAYMADGTREDETAHTSLKTRILLKNKVHLD